jgi:hypothetical protein
MPTAADTADTAAPSMGRAAAAVDGDAVEGLPLPHPTIGAVRG